jgi:hypothetical protein
MITFGIFLGQEFPIIPNVKFIVIEYLQKVVFINIKKNNNVN